MLTAQATSLSPRNNSAQNNIYDCVVSSKSGSLHGSILLHHKTLQNWIFRASCPFIITGTGYFAIDICTALIIQIHIYIYIYLKFYLPKLSFNFSLYISQIILYSFFKSIFEKLHMINEGFDHLKYLVYIQLIRNIYSMYSVSFRYNPNNSNLIVKTQP